MEPKRQNNAHDIPNCTTSTSNKPGSLGLMPMTGGVRAAQRPSWRLSATTPDSSGLGIWGSPTLSLSVAETLPDQNPRLFITRRVT